MPWACEDERFVMYYSFFFITATICSIRRKPADRWDLQALRCCASCFLIKKKEKKKNMEQLWCLMCWERKTAQLSPSISPPSAGRRWRRQSPDQYFILAPEKTPEEVQTETFCLSEHQNTASFPFLSAKWKIDERWRRQWCFHSLKKCWCQQSIKLILKIISWRLSENTHTGDSSQKC